MRRAIVVSPDPSNRAGGVERMAQLLESVLASEGWEVRVVGPTAHAPRWQARLGGRYLADSRSAARAAAQLECDLLVTNGYLGVGYARRRVPRVHVYHGTMVGNTRAAARSLPRREQARRLLGAGLAEALSGRGAYAVAVAEKAAHEVWSHYRVRCDAVVPNGVDTELFAPRPRSQARAALGLEPDGRLALFVGRLDYGKGAELLLPSTRAAGFELLVAGPQQAAGAVNLGVLEPARLAQAYAAADCVLFPSLYEGCSFVVLEALATGTPLITTRVGWMPTLLRTVPAYEALCVEPEVQDIAARLRALPTLASPAPQQARTWVGEHNSLQRWGERWRAVIATAAAGALRRA
jgi:glycosyltransferase involved in cell wall biosynthesis